jgi:hypothetical protein
MLDYQGVVESIRSQLQSNDHTLSDQVRELAASYAAACQEVNRRLVRCDEFLKKGLRSEAIHLAQAEPVLLDVVAVLDFPERPQWEEMSLTYGLPAPPQLQLATAAALNEAYAAEQPLESLLREHRRLALARAPLSARLAVLRRLARLDAQNPVWAEDVAAFELARFEEIQQEVRGAVTRNDRAALVQAYDEVTRTEWLARPPDHLVRHVRQSARAGLRERARGVLQGVAHELDAAVEKGDLGRARALRAEWQSQARFAELGPGEPLGRRGAAALDRLDKLEQWDARQQYHHQKALHALEAALTMPTTADGFEKLYQTVRRFKRGPAPELNDRCQARLEGLRLQEAAAERRVLLLVIAMLVFAGLATIVGILVYHGSRTGRPAMPEQRQEAPRDSQRAFRAGTSDVPRWVGAGAARGPVSHGAPGDGPGGPGAGTGLRGRGAGLCHRPAEEPLTSGL